MLTVAKVNDRVFQLVSPDGISQEEHLRYYADVLSKTTVFFERYLGHYRKTGNEEDFSIIEELTAQAGYLRQIFLSLDQEHGAQLPQSYDFRETMLDFTNEITPIINTRGDAASVSFVRAARANEKIKVMIDQYHRLGQTERGFFGRLFFGSHQTRMR